MIAPEIPGGLLPQQRLIGDELGIEQHPALEGALGEGALTKTVNGEDRGFIHAGECISQALYHLTVTLQRLQQFR